MESRKLFCHLTFFHFAFCLSEEQSGWAEVYQVLEPSNEAQVKLDSTHKATVIGTLIPMDLLLCHYEEGEERERIKVEITKD